ncbi:MAG: GNAT family N-acetyltransferase [Clostridia bacterium]|nr:GNAT family N-acetyltransferase [Clostridia bacterium]
MKNITHRQYRILADHTAVYQFMLEIYERDWHNGVPAPFLEYALCSDWMDKSFVHRNRIWFDGDRIVALCFYENPVSDTYLSLRPGYEALAEEMIAYAIAHMPKKDGQQRLVLFGGQAALMQAARNAGLHQEFAYWDKVRDFSTPLEHPLPEGFRFADTPLDPAKCAQCCWKGFGHEAEEGPWDGEYESALRLMTAPHATHDLAVAIENEAGEYVCYAGMWWTPENHLAYMEPLCTVPAYQRLGLASAALSELYRRTKRLGATHMTGGGHPFYDSMGYKPMVEWTFWMK